jgi:hypothetical protein
MANFQLNKQQIIERGIPEKIEEKETLKSLAEIACFMGCSINKVRDCIQMRGLPAAQVGNSYMVTKEGIRIWLQQQHLAAVEKHMWDRKIHPRKASKGSEDIATFRRRYGPRPTETQKRTKIDIASVVRRIQQS